MEEISFQQVEITGGFWKQRQDINRKITIYSVMDRFRETGRFDAFQCNWKEGMPNKPHVFWDSDVAKWIEGVSYILEKEQDSRLECLVEEIIDLIEKNQDESGYFNIYFTVCEPENRFQKRTEHELYCAGHLMEAAVAYYQATKKDRFLKLMCKYADHIEQVFLKEDTAAFVTCGHEEIELALVKLYHCTGETRYLNLSNFFVDSRGNNEKDSFHEFASASCDQSHLPVRQQKTAEGHSVRACYLYSAMADLAKEYQDEELLSACQQLFDNIISKKMYITGGIGQSHLGEAFTIDYDLPNQNAYAETCAAISLAFFAQRMIHLEADSKYADTIERVLYNGIISGISLEGNTFFYENPLEIDPKLRTKDTSIKKENRTRYPLTQRVKVFDCSCCPPNLNRFFASIGNYIYTKNNDTYFVHQFMESIMSDGEVQIIQSTNYPNDGFIRIQTKSIKRLAFRIPSWCRKFSVNAPYIVEKGYAYMKEIPENIEIMFEIQPVLMQSSPYVQENGGRAALQMGPVVYCLEGIDNGINLRSVWVDSNLNYEIVYDNFFGTNTIITDGFKMTRQDALYSPLKSNMENVKLKFIPYYGFANRGETEMVVWVNYR